MTTKKPRGELPRYHMPRMCVCPEKDAHGLGLGSRMACRNYSQGIEDAKLASKLVLDPQEIDRLIVAMTFLISDYEARADPRLADKALLHKLKKLRPEQK